VASAAIHGLFLLFWLDVKPPATASGNTDDVVLELVSIDLPPAKLPAHPPVAKHSAPKTNTTDAMNGKPASRQTRSVLSDNIIPETSTLPVLMPMTRAKAESGSKESTEQPAMSVSQRIAQQVPEPHSDHQSDAAEMDRIRMLVRNHLETFKYYPASARRRGIEGHVEVGFTLTHDGAADQVSVLHGSGYAVLDHAALETVYRAQPFPIENGKYRFSLRFKRL